MPGETSAESSVLRPRTAAPQPAGANLASGAGADNPGAAFRLSQTPIDVALLAEAMIDERAGACVTFEGRVRNTNEGRQVSELEYEAYPRMALKEGARVVAEACSRFEVIDARCIHRLGRLGLGEVAVWVAVLSAHREEGFAACRYIIDEVKARVPIWKKEHYREGGTSWVGGSVATEQTE